MYIDPLKTISFRNLHSKTWDGSEEDCVRVGTERFLTDYNAYDKWKGPLKSEVLQKRSLICRSSGRGGRIGQLEGQIMLEFCASH